MPQSPTKMELQVCERFTQEFHKEPEKLVVSPGRVNIIGEHTDYNNGYVLPMAIDRYLMMAVSRRDDDLVKVVTTGFEEKIEFSLSDLEKGRFTWGEYITGCLWGLKRLGVTLAGFDMVITGNIPVGASLSSSAALELGVLRTASYSAGFDWEPLEMAKLAQRAENEWVGMNCGLMDQAICACGRKDHALLIDFQELLLTPCPLPESSSIVILDTTTRRGLIDSAYNERRRQCDSAARVMGVETLRQANSNLLEQNRDNMKQLEYLRARHVIRENDRVLKAVQAMTKNDCREVGDLMYESHCSLRDDFDVSGDALNMMVECAMKQENCFGARMTGAGFAGCAVALVAKGSEQAFVDAVFSDYYRSMHVEPRIYVCHAAEGTTIRPL